MSSFVRSSILGLFFLVNCLERVGMVSHSLCGAKTAGLISKCQDVIGAKHTLKYVFQATYLLVRGCNW